VEGTEGEEPVEDVSGFSCFLDGACWEMSIYLWFREMDSFFLGCISSSQVVFVFRLR
jgi:hypothetical protein